MTQMTENGVTTTTGAGQEQYELFRPAFRKNKKMCHYDYRHENGQLFSCIKPTLEACRAARDEWAKQFAGA